MNESQLMRLDSVGTEIYAIQGYFRGLTVGQRTPELSILNKTKISCDSKPFSEHGFSK